MSKLEAPMLAPGRLAIWFLLAAAGCSDSVCPTGRTVDGHRCIEVDRDDAIAEPATPEDGGFVTRDVGTDDPLELDAGLVCGDEVCDGLDNDCDGVTDESLRTTYYRDCDHDSFGTSLSVEACTLAEATIAFENRCSAATNAVDCNDECELCHPDATEVCDDRDNDCDGDSDEAVRTEYYLDRDGDGFGAGIAMEACEAPLGDYALNDDDCDDYDEAAFPDSDGYHAEERQSGGWDFDCDEMITREFPSQHETVSSCHDGWVDSPPPCGESAPWAITDRFIDRCQVLRQDTEQQRCR